MSTQPEDSVTYGQGMDVKTKAVGFLIVVYLIKGTKFDSAIDLANDDYISCSANVIGNRSPETYMTFKDMSLILESVANKALEILNGSSK